jgi:hypothetical protein
MNFVRKRGQKLEETARNGRFVRWKTMEYLTNSLNACRLLAESFYLLQEEKEVYLIMALADKSERFPWQD